MTNASTPDIKWAIKDDDYHLQFRWLASIGNDQREPMPENQARQEIVQAIKRGKANNESDKSANR
ncbi:hypothetical protein DSCOOX_53690 [Desulfosarcina ovata subsp. ovata]|uniref:Uncharacterized protein n=1 Tax=Desulfosarcina ovata subsp. ovata TaxID=2752305 RepID=A0A5K8AI73_9BACT|nr:hypothetical protein DSCOOX_53690 [Desulfosarcina ovata subsp. ovata]